MGQLLLVRHGQASWWSEDYDVLSETGWEQGRLLGKALAEQGVGPAAVVHGGMRRHRETAEACAVAAGWELEPRVDPGWAEFDHEHVLAQHPEQLGPEPTAETVQAWFDGAIGRWTSGEHDDNYTESFGAFWERVATARDRTAGLAEEGDVVVFTSGGPVAVTVASLVDPEAEEPARARIWRRLNITVVNASVTRCVRGRRGTTLVTFNEHTHLPSERLTYR